MKLQQTQVGLTANFARSTAKVVGRCISVSVANRYMLDGPGIANPVEEIFAVPVSNDRGANPIFFIMCNG